MSHDPELTKLMCNYNDITQLDLSHNPKLTVLYCEDNKLSSLDLSHDPKLRFLYAAINSFTDLDIRSNPVLVKTYTDGVYPSFPGESFIYGIHSRAQCQLMNLSAELSILSAEEKPVKLITYLSSSATEHTPEQNITKPDSLQN